MLWASASRGVTVKELRAAIGPTRERFEAAYAYLLDYPLLGLTVLRQGDEFQLVTSGQVAASVERHLNAPRPVSLSGAAMQVLTIVAYRQPVSQAGIESVRGISSDSAIGTLLQRQLIALDDHRLFSTTAAFLKYFGLRDLADYLRSRSWKASDCRMTGPSSSGVNRTTEDSTGERATHGMTA